MTELEAAYIAGLFDGEGSITFGWYKATKNEKKYGKLLVKIAQNDRSVLDWIVSRAGAGTVHVRKLRPRCKQAHDFVISHEGARQFIATIRPFLRIKAAKVDDKIALDSIHCKRRAAA